MSISEKIPVSVTYRDKLLGCWTGKNIGGTLGGPFEWKREVNQVTFYTQNLDGNPAPNDDLDLQLIWLLAAEEKGVYQLNERVLSEYWLNYITGPWNEYGVCKANLRNGLTPPLSGSCNNDKWKFSNGAWIRSEIWACLFPGSPLEAARFAYCDACCDHCGEGIYAEIFTAAMESAAFVVNDLRAIIDIGLAHIPGDCRIARSVKLVISHYDQGHDFLTAREAVVRDSADLGWFQAPGNIGFVLIGLLYGRGDFGRSICLATNCGDDTDCTAGTVGALMGILLGRSGIPEKWTAPIGDRILTCSISTYDSGKCMSLPKTLNELSDRVVKLAQEAHRTNPALPPITLSAPSVNVSPEDLYPDATAIRRLWERAPYELTFDLPWGTVAIDYGDGPAITPGETKKITIKIGNVRFIEKTATARLSLPPEWTPAGPLSCAFMIQMGNISTGAITFTPGYFAECYCYLPLEIRLHDRACPYTVNIPFQNRGSVDHTLPLESQEYYAATARRRGRILAEPVG